MSEPALGSCVKQGMERSCQRVHSIIWTQPGHPGRERGPSKEGEEGRGRERERERQATPEVTLHRSERHTGTHHSLPQAFLKHKINYRAEVTQDYYFWMFLYVYPIKRRNERREKIQPVNSRRCSSLVFQLLIVPFFFFFFFRSLQFYLGPIKCHSFLNYSSLDSRVIALCCTHWIMDPPSLH